MPQVKGQGTWLTNVRQEAPGRRTGIDESHVKMENERMEAEMKRTLESIHLAGHRAMADRMYEMKETKTTVKTYEIIQTLAEKEKSAASIVAHRKNKGGALSAGPGRTDAESRPTSSNYGANRPHTTGFANNKYGLDDDDDSDDDFEFSPAEDDDDDYYDPRPKAKTPGLPSRPGTSMRGTPAPPARKKTKSKMPPKRPRQTFIGRSLREIRKSLYDEFTTEREDDDDSEPHRTTKTFQELRDASNIDKIRDAQAQAKLDNFKRVRTKKLEDEQFRVQQRLKIFYRELETFKGCPNKHNPRSGYTYVHT